MVPRRRGDLRRDLGRAPARSAARTRADRVDRVRRTPVRAGFGFVYWAWWRHRQGSRRFCWRAFRCSRSGWHSPTARNDSERMASLAPCSRWRERQSSSAPVPKPECRRPRCWQSRLAPPAWPKHSSSSRHSPRSIRCHECGEHGSRSLHPPGAQRESSARSLPPSRRRRWRRRHISSSRGRSGVRLSSSSCSAGRRARRPISSS